MASATKRLRQINGSDGSFVSEQTSRRHKSLRAALHKALDQSSASIDRKAAVAECFGADASIFAENDESGGEDATDMLANLIAGVIERANERLKSDFESLLDTENIRARLVAFDRLLERDEREKQEMARVEEEDRDSAREAALSSRLPDGVSTDDLMWYHAYRVKIEERDRLLAEIASIEKENENVRQQIEVEKKLTKEKVAAIEEKGKRVELAAEVCSFSGVG